LVDIALQNCHPLASAVAVLLVSEQEETRTVMSLMIFGTISMKIWSSAHMLIQTMRFQSLLMLMMTQTISKVVHWRIVAMKQQELWFILRLICKSPPNWPIKQLESFLRAVRNCTRLKNPWFIC